MKRQTLLNTKELKDFIKHTVQNNQYLQENGKVPVAINIEGEAGLGKTSVIMQVAEELNLQCVKLNLSQIEEVGDLVGFPMKKHKLVKDSEELWVNDNAYDYYIENGYKPTGESKMSHAQPEWIQGVGEGGILLLDDFSRADSRFIQATMELIDRQTYVSWKLPKNWHIILTSNPDNGDYHVSSLDAAQKTRFISVDLKFDVKVWAEWAEENRIDTRCINFIPMHPELVENGVNPRSFTTFFNAISSISNFAENLPLIKMIGDGSIGFEASNLFVMFINNNLDKIASPQVMLTGTSWETVKSEIKEAIYTNGNYRADISNLLATRFTNYTLVYAKDNKVDDKIHKRIKELVLEPELFQTDTTYAITKKLFSGAREKFQKLLTDPEMVKLIVK